MSTSDFVQDMEGDTEVGEHLSTKEQVKRRDMKKRNGVAGETRGRPKQPSSGHSIAGQTVHHSTIPSYGVESPPSSDRVCRLSLHLCLMVSL